MRALGKPHLERFRLALWENAEEKRSGFKPLISYLTTGEMDAILDTFNLLLNGGQLKVQQILKHSDHVLGNLDAFADVLRAMDEDFKPIRTANQEKAKAGRAATAAKKAALKALEKTADAARPTGIVIHVDKRCVLFELESHICADFLEGHGK